MLNAREVKMGPNGNLVDMVGQRFGKLTVMSRAGVRQERAAWRCLCDCGKVVDVRGDKLRAGRVQSCGRRSRCFISSDDLARAEYRAWAGMKSRCINVGDPYTYRNYGGRGIKVCDRWRDSFENFLSDMGPRPSSKHTLDRIDNDGDYTPENCRWVTRDVQARNRQRTAFIKIDGKRIALRSFLEEKGIDFDMVYRAITSVYLKGRPYLRANK